MRKEDVSSIPLYEAYDENYIAIIGQTLQQPISTTNPELDYMQKHVKYAIATGDTSHLYKVSQQLKDFKSKVTKDTPPIEKVTVSYPHDLLSLSSEQCLAQTNDMRFAMCLKDRDGLCPVTFDPNRCIKLSL